MIDGNKEIAERIKDGSYYKDAREWYVRRYLYPITERTFFIVITLVVTIVFLISLNNINALMGVNKRIPVPIKVENSTDYMSVIQALAKQSETTQEAVAKYLLIDYLKTREEYFHEQMHGAKLKYKLKKIKSSSSKSVLNEYQSYISEINPYSPMVRYRDHTSRSISIKSFKFLDSDIRSGKVRIIFEASTKKYKDKETIKSLWEATVHFRLPDIETIARTGAPLRFLVKYYKAKPVK